MEKFFILVPIGEPKAKTGGWIRSRAIIPGLGPTMLRKDIIKWNVKLLTSLNMLMNVMKLKTD
jgi:hypothetical protein